MLRGCGRAKAAGHLGRIGRGRAACVAGPQKAPSIWPYIGPALWQARTRHRRRAGRADLPRPRTDAMANRRCIFFGQRPLEARRRPGGRPGLCPQLQALPSSAGRRISRRHRRGLGAVDTGVRHPGVCRPIVRCRPIRHSDRPSPERRGVERRGRPRGRGVGGRHRRVRHGRANGTGCSNCPQHEIASDLRHDPGSNGEERVVNQEETLAAREKQS